MKTQKSKEQCETKVHRNNAQNRDEIHVQMVGGHVRTI